VAAARPGRGAAILNAPVLRALASINLAASERNAARLRGTLTGGAQLCAVVKARASGHGASQVARAALAGGASSLAVATAEEASALRRDGLTAPVLVLGAISEEELGVALQAGAELVAWDERFVALLAREAARRDQLVRVHVKYDTGLGRLGTRDLDQALAVAQAVHAAGGLRLHGAMTHFSTADGDPEFFTAQLTAFEPFVQRMRAVAPVVAHADNSAATLRDPASHFDMVRCGIALHGCDPMNEDPDRVGLEPVMELSTYVAAVKRAQAGESAGYGRRFVAQRETWIATLPFGYADGLSRAHTGNGEVLIAGARYPIVGTISMDNVTVDLGPAAQPPVSVGERAVLVGRDGEQRITVEQFARRIGTIHHEVLCGISDRVTRRWHRDGTPVRG
jgi:alanine racemase